MPTSTRTMKIKLLMVRESTDTLINSPEAIYEDMKEEAKADRECFWVLHLNSRHLVIEKELVAVGSLDTAIVHPRETFRKAIINSAAAIITVHNHPSGGLEPSLEDETLWKRLNAAGELLGINVLDHLIISGEGCYSWKRAGGMQ